MYISERPPRFVYPSLIANLPALPISTSGKINRRALMELDLASFHETNADVGLPQSDVEVALHTIFSDICPGRRFFRRVVQTQHRFEQHLSQVCFSPRDFFSQFLFTLVHRPSIPGLSNVIINALGQDQSRSWPQKTPRATS